MTGSGLVMTTSTVASSFVQVSFEDASAPPPWLQAAVEQGLGERVEARAGFRCHPGMRR